MGRSNVIRIATFSRSNYRRLFCFTCRGRDATKNGFHFGIFRIIRYDRLTKGSFKLRYGRNHGTRLFVKGSNSTKANLFVFCLRFLTSSMVVLSYVLFNGACAFSILRVGLNATVRGKGLESVRLWGTIIGSRNVRDHRNIFRHTTFNFSPSRSDAANDLRCVLNCYVSSKATIRVGTLGLVSVIFKDQIRDRDRIRSYIRPLSAWKGASFWYVLFRRDSLFSLVRWFF